MLFRQCHALRILPLQGVLEVLRPQQAAYIATRDASKKGLFNHDFVSVLRLLRVSGWRMHLL